MNTFECILGPEYPPEYEVHSFALYSCISASHASVAELLFSRLKEGYTGNGGGFSHYAAGISVASAYEYDTENWEDASAWVMKHMRVRGTHVAEKLRQSIAAEATEAEIARLQAKESELKEKRASLLDASVEYAPPDDGEDD